MLLETGIHPAVATKDNTERYRMQLDQSFFFLIGIEKYRHHTPAIINGHSGFLNNFLILIIVGR